MRAIDHDFCQMKRMFVDPRFLGQGVGLVLGLEIINSARAAGINGMRLDTSIRQAEASGFYQRLGFRQIDPSCWLPETLRAWLIFMELKLDTQKNSQVGSWCCPADSVLSGSSRDYRALQERCATINQ